MKKRLEKAKKRIEELEKELKKYKNSNTPLSAHKHIQPNTQGLRAKQGARRGAPIGHKGKTIQRLPAVYEIIDSDESPGCHSHNVRDDKLLNRTTEDIPQPVIPEPKATEVHIKKCLDCGLRFIPPHNETPLKGSFGINIMILVIFAKFLLRGVLRKTADFLDSGFSLRMTPASVNAIVQRVADAACSEYEKLKMRIKEASRIYLDETSFSVLGI